MPKEKEPERLFYRVLNNKPVHFRGQSTNMREGKMLDSRSFDEATIALLEKQGVVFERITKVP